MSSGTAKTERRLAQIVAIVDGNQPDFDARTSIRSLLRRGPELDENSNGETTNAARGLRPQPPSVDGPHPLTEAELARLEKRTNNVTYSFVPNTRTVLRLIAQARRAVVLEKTLAEGSAALLKIADELEALWRNKKAK